MNYIIAGSGVPNSLDKEHIVNTMFRVARDCKRAYFLKKDECVDYAIWALKAWMDKNEDFRVQIFEVSANEKVRENLPDIIDRIFLFIDADCDNDPEFQNYQKLSEQDGVRVDKYVLKSWDEVGKNMLCGND